MLRLGRGGILGRSMVFELAAAADVFWARDGRGGIGGVAIVYEE